MTDIYFYRFLVNKQVFFRSQYSYALVNLKPLVPGHVLIVPLRTSALRLSDLSTEESQDYMRTLQLVHKFIQKTYKADSLNIAIQDGPEAGQSIPHLHTHLIPRYKHDGYGDAIYQKLENADIGAQYQEFFTRKALFQETLLSKSELDVDDEARKPRTEETMFKEAEWLSKEISKYIENLDYTENWNKEN